jgi:hypothetical protein
LSLKNFWRKFSFTRSFFSKTFLGSLTPAKCSRECVFFGASCLYCYQLTGKQNSHNHLMRDSLMRLLAHLVSYFTNLSEVVHVCVVEAHSLPPILSRVTTIFFTISQPTPHAHCPRRRWLCSTMLAVLLIHSGRSYAIHFSWFST